MKTKEERNALKNEVGAWNDELAELNEDELEQVSGGMPLNVCSGVGQGGQLDPANGESFYHPSGISGYLNDESVGWFDRP